MLKTNILDELRSIRCQNDLDRYLLNPENYRRTHKKNYTVSICMPKYGTHVKNVLEKSDYITSSEKPFVIKGTRGETWVIDMKKLSRTYRLPDGRDITKEALQSKCQRAPDGSLRINWFNVETRPDAAVNWAIFVPKKYIVPVATSWGDVLQCNSSGVPHGIGDFIVCTDNMDMPNFSDRWVVNGEIFPTTYDMRPFTCLEVGKTMRNEGQSMRIR